MADTAALPCIPLPNPKPLSIKLPFGSELKGIADLSKGPPSDCALIHSLMLQIGPLLAGLQCLLMLGKIFSSLSNFSPTNPKSVTDLVGAALDFVNKCIPKPIDFVCTVLDVVRLLVKYLKCLVEAVLSVLQFQVGIDFSAAQDNPVLFASLNCAQNNAAASMSQLKDAIAIVESILSLMDPVIQMAESFLPQPVKDGLKTISDAKKALESVVSAGGASVGVPGVQDTVQTLQTLKSNLEQIEGILDELPC